MAGKGEALGWKVAGMGTAILGGIAARKALTTGWKLATGAPPPANPADPDVQMREAVLWAVASGVAVGLARMLASRKAADYWRRSLGHLPPGLQAGAA